MKGNKTIIQFAQYLVVGGLATLVEWGCFYLFSPVFGINYLLSTALAFVFSTFSNWLFGKWIMFKNKGNPFLELLKIYLASIVGLLLNLVLMWLLVEKLTVDEMVSKMITTAIVFGWNFFIRKLVIYKI